MNANVYLGVERWFMWMPTREWNPIPIKRACRGALLTWFRVCCPHSKPLLSSYFAKNIALTFIKGSIEVLSRPQPRMEENDEGLVHEARA